MTIGKPVFMILKKVKSCISRIIRQCSIRFRRPIAFMHIPKTAGTSINDSLWFAFNPAYPLKKRMDKSIYGSFDISTFHQSVVIDIFCGSTSMQQNTDFISGHFGLSTIQNYFPKAKIVTFLREPSTRILSHWLYWRFLPETDVQRLGEMSDYVRASKYTLINFLHLPPIYCQLDNLQTRMLLWPHPLIPSDDLISEKHDDILIQQALAKLASLSHVDVVENPQLERNLSDWIRKPISLSKLNVTTHSLESSKVMIHDELTPEAWARLNHFSRLDLKLWFAFIDKKMPGTNAQALRSSTIGKTIKRYEMM